MSESSGDQDAVGDIINRLRLRGRSSVWFLPILEAGGT